MPRWLPSYSNIIYWTVHLSLLRVWDVTFIIPKIPREHGSLSGFSFYFTGLCTHAPGQHYFNYSGSMFYYLGHWSCLILTFFFPPRFSLAVLVYSIWALKKNPLTQWIPLKLCPTQCFLSRIALLTIQCVTVLLIWYFTWYRSTFYCLLCYFCILLASAQTGKGKEKQDL